MSGERLPCCVPFCRCTTARPFAEWICAKHWRAVPAQTKRRWRIMRRHPERPGYAMAWEACKRAAIETAGGIG